MKKDREKKQKYSNITDAAIMGSTSEESALYASANREHLSVLDRLEEISKRKINPNYPTGGLFCGNQRTSPC